MRTVLLSLTLAALASPALAQARPDSLSLSCDALSRLVRQNGAVVIGTGPNIFDRYVRDAGFCPQPQTVQPSWLQSADTAQCFVGYRCRDRGPRGRR
ncbi:MAG TPA: hypothetical protein VLA00_05000 [Xanthobacteraceae bacterium]|nr:hypothetical protein [Xanthobacteraceae bacterium]